jgi:hypothetical protein
MFNLELTNLSEVVSVLIRPGTCHSTWPSEVFLSALLGADANVQAGPAKTLEDSHVPSFHRYHVPIPEESWRLQVTEDIERT